MLLSAPFLELFIKQVSDGTQDFPFLARHQIMLAWLVL